MPAEVLGSAESLASKSITPGAGGFVSSVAGKGGKVKIGGKLKKFGAAGFLMAMIIVVIVVFGAGNLIPAAISERLLEETDVQYADAVQSKELVFQEAMRQGDIPDNTTEILADNSYTVGYVKNGEFVEGNQCEKDGGEGTECVLKKGDEIIEADDFIDKVNSDVELYDAFNNATYSRAAYWYDDSAEEVFEEIGTNRNNFTSDSDFDEVMTEKMGEGSDVTASTCWWVWVPPHWECSTTENNSDGNIDVYIKDVADHNKDDDNSKNATMKTSDTLKAADTKSKEQRSSLFSLLILENISKMQYGDGNESKINEAMNYLYEDRPTTVVDTKTGEKIEINGSAMESPSLYAVLSASEIDPDKVANYSNDRIIKIVENQYGAGTKVGSNIIEDTTSSIKSSNKGGLGRANSYNGETASEEKMSKVKYVVESSLANNGFESIGGIEAGEMLVEGMVNVGKELAKASGGAPGDEEAVAKYMKLTSDILAMDAAADRLHRSPFDITSKNTFLGSIVYNFAIGLQLSPTSNPILSGMMSFIRTTGGAFTSLLPGAHADDINTYLTKSGDCETLDRIGVSGSPQCAMVATFDATTLDDPFHNSAYLSFVANNTKNDGTSILSESDLEDFILYNDERSEPLGITDGDVLDDMIKRIPALDFILGLIPDGLSGILKKIIIQYYVKNRKPEFFEYASGGRFANSSRNAGNWNTYKWAQRYVSLTRAGDALKQYAVNYDGRVAYNFSQFAWGENPVLACINEYESRNTEVAEEELDAEIELSEEDKELLVSYLNDYPELQKIVQQALGDLN